MMKINVPSEGAILSFKIKREGEWALGDISSIIQHRSYIRSEFGDEVLETLFDGDYNDDSWQTFTTDLKPHAGDIITLVFQVDNWMIVLDDEPVNMRLGWMFVDDVAVYLTGDYNDDGAAGLQDIILVLEILSGITDGGQHPCRSGRRRQSLHGRCDLSAANHRGGSELMNPF